MVSAITKSFSNLPDFYYCNIGGFSAAVLLSCLASPLHVRKIIVGLSKHEMQRLVAQFLTHFLTAQAARVRSSLHSLSHVAQSV
jgi:hypothetical protein